MSANHHLIPAEASEWFRERWTTGMLSPELVEAFHDVWGVTISKRQIWQAAYDRKFYRPSRTAEARRDSVAPKALEGLIERVLLRRLETPVRRPEPPPVRPVTRFPAPPGGYRTAATSGRRA